MYTRFNEVYIFQYYVHKIFDQHCRMVGVFREQMSLVCSKRTNERTRADLMRRADTQTTTTTTVLTSINNSPNIHCWKKSVCMPGSSRARMFCLWKNESTYARFVPNQFVSTPPPHNSVNKCESYRVGSRDILISNKEKLW